MAKVAIEYLEMEEDMFQLTIEYWGEDAAKVK
jgi:hypothetical protein